MPAVVGADVNRRMFRMQITAAKLLLYPALCLFFCLLLLSYICSYERDSTFRPCVFEASRADWHAQIAYLGVVVCCNGQRCEDDRRRERAFQ